MTVERSKMPERNVEAGDLGLAAGLASLKVGDKVFMHPRFGEPYLTEVTHIDSHGRLFICTPEREYITNWRYGFNPQTGTAHHYEFSTMRFGTSEQVATEEARMAEEERLQQVAREERIRLDRVRKAAPELLEACKEFVRKVECGEARSTRSYAQMKAAIARAEGREP